VGEEVGVVGVGRETEDEPPEEADAGKGKISQAVSRCLL
jgi:hypothetical protein